MLALAGAICVLPARADTESPDAPGQRVEILAAQGATGLFSLPATRGELVPAVLLLHDALGPDTRSEPYAVQLLAAGIAVLDLLQEAPDGQAREAALSALAADARVDPARLGVLGFGAGAAAAAEARLPARALLYPGCAGLAHAAALPGAVLLLYGTADAANPRPDCDAAAAALAEGGAAVRRLEYPGAGYAWDRPPFGMGERALVPAPGGNGRVAVQPWPALAGMAAAQVAGFFATALGP